MPSRNTTRLDLEETYYHVYARGASKQPIYRDAEDYAFFLQLFARYLSPEQQKNTDGVPYPHFRGSIELLAYCLMGNHFHLFVYQKEQGALSDLMKSVLASYTRYFNRKYRRSGSLFESRYKASPITNDAYLIHISRYIHLNPRSWRLYPYSSIRDYRGKTSTEWLQPQKILSLFSDSKAYTEVLADYEDHRDQLAALKLELADL